MTSYDVIISPKPPPVRRNYPINSPQKRTPHTKAKLNSFFLFKHPLKKKKKGKRKKQKKKKKKINVVKRDGRQESVRFDKITARLKKLSYSLNTDHCDPVLVSQKVCAGVYKGVTTRQLDELAAETAAVMTTNHPDHACLAAGNAVSNLHKNTKKSFSETVKDL